MALFSSVVFSRRRLAHVVEPVSAQRSAERGHHLTKPSSTPEFTSPGDGQPAHPTHWAMCALLQTKGISNDGIVVSCLLTLYL